MSALNRKCVITYIIHCNIIKVILLISYMGGGAGKQKQNPKCIETSKKLNILLKGN